MLQPHELKLASGFERDYMLRGTKRDQVCQIGNAVTAGLLNAPDARPALGETPTLPRACDCEYGLRREAWALLHPDDQDGDPTA